VATFGPHITLHQPVLAGSRLTLTWHSNRPPPENLSIFVHLLDAQGNLLSQADGVPYNGLYPPAHWQPGQPVEDNRQLDLSRNPAAIAVGIYHPATGQRLPATATNGQPLPNHSFVMPVSK